MRDVKRIYEFMNGFVTYWVNHQDLRFTQVANLFISEAQDKGYIRSGDPFFIEEDEWIKALTTLNMEFSERNPNPRPVANVSK
jgi:hypothetical protein